MTLSDGSSFFLLKDVQLTEGVYAGCGIAAAERQRLERLSTMRAAMESALLLLSRAPHSRAGLRLKLLQRGYDAEAADAALARSAEMGYLDDEHFAEAWILTRLDRHPEGKLALVAHLRERGVARETAEEVVGRVVSDAMEEECLLRVLRRGGGASGGDGGSPRRRAGAGARRRAGAAEAAREAARLRALGFPSRLVRRHLPEPGRFDSG